MHNLDTLLEIYIKAAIIYFPWTGRKTGKYVTRISFFWIGRVKKKVLPKARCTSILWNKKFSK